MERNRLSGPEVLIHKGFLLSLLVLALGWGDNIELAV